MIAHAPDVHYGSEVGYALAYLGIKSRPDGDMLKHNLHCRISLKCREKNNLPIPEPAA
jgi:hypothetical protein